MAEPVRLVIWDLDETFWRGTLTEGGHAYRQECHDIVIELARRGIMSAICSKNDFETVKQILQQHEIWDYFIFPSINWEPKGSRIQALIESVQLRPETVMLIDDNPMNLQEAKFFTPNLQTAPDTFIPEILTSPLFKGKDDSKLSRLSQYKLLEKRKADEAVAVSETGGSNVEFLRSSNIRVRIEYDIEKHIDRAIELINRTNQLNFTKVRLPEDPALARKQLLTQVRSFRSQAGLVEVFDNYGNYGYCGFFLIKARPSRPLLIHFCFSCRILNMGVEAWLYQTFGRPVLRPVGEVLSDPVKAEPVDWITPVTEIGAGTDATGATPPRLNWVATRGGCDMMALNHYFRMASETVLGQFNLVRRGITYRLDHSLCARYAIQGVPAEAAEAFWKIGYEPSDFDGSLFDFPSENSLCIYSNWPDVATPVYRHRETGVLVPFRGAANNDDADLGPDALRCLAYLRDNFDRVGMLTEEQVKENARIVFGTVPAHSRMFVLLPLDSRPGPDGQIITRRPNTFLNRWMTEVAAEFPRVEVLSVAQFINDASDIQNTLAHYDRMVYFRIYQHLMQVASEPAASYPEMPRAAVA